MFPESLTKFINDNNSSWTPKMLPANLWKSDWPWAPIRIELDTIKVNEELQKLKYFFVAHRDKDKINSYGHEGWESLTLHGLDYDKTEHWDRYGTLDETYYRWTEVCEYAPYIVSLIKSLPYSKFDRVRIMKLSAGGYIMPHNDGPGRIFGPLNIALTNPDGCKFIFKDYGVVPFEPGKGFLLDIGNEHCVINNSSEDRYHIIVHGTHTSEMHQLVKRSL